MTTRQATLRTNYPATIEPLATPKPRRGEDELCQTARPTIGRAGPRSSGSRVPGRVAALNAFPAVGMPVTETVGQVCPGKREVHLSPDLCNKAPFGVKRSEINGTWQVTLNLGWHEADGTILLFSINILSPLQAVLLDSMYRVVHELYRDTPPTAIELPNE